ncbi:hypothetical protein [Gloeothece verrucosa]|uniref:hypothetical protein n=1 Tax=Gloeothece verrucosa TaxID=2546359 RepID=UPI0002DB0A51|nr:hypothetical protein [Gloeothece verrucosa]
MIRHPIALARLTWSQFTITSNRILSVFASDATGKKRGRGEVCRPFLTPVQEQDLQK